MAGLQWRKIPVSLSELCLDTTLRCGQSFRWRKSDDDIWSCALHGRLLSLRQDDSHVHYRSSHSNTELTPPTPPSSSTPSLDEPVLGDNGDTESFIKHYLNLDVNLTKLYETWSAADTNFKKRAPRFAGIRILRQDAWEALLGFICSSNNNIIRISQMMENLCLHYGPMIGHIGEKPFHDMPTAAALAKPSVEAHLRQLGFGYRAKYIHQTAVMVSQEREPGWLDDLRNPECPKLGGKVSSAGTMQPAGREGYRKAHAELLALQGVGPKVADCVCLMGLGWDEAVPVDTHVWQIAQRDYRFGKGKFRSLTQTTYDAIGQLFRGLWGKEAGWAHSVLFAADLRTFSEKVTTKVEIKQIKEESQEPGTETIEVKTQQSRVKREIDEDEKSMIQIDSATSSRRSKRQKR